LIRFIVYCRVISEVREHRVLMWRSDSAIFRRGWPACGVIPSRVVRLG
jgi:hypothetical protein